MTLTTYETLPCCVCKETSMLIVDLEKIARWEAGGHAQNVWPEMDADERELLITGTHPKCWDDFFSDDGEWEALEDGQV